MSEGPLLVPMHLDAMVLNQEASVATPFNRFQPDYDALQNFSPVGPPPFGTGSGSQGPPAAGIYLHWTLPRPLRQGAHDQDTGETSFPYVPNRWLVVRIQNAEPPGPVLAWVVESDYLDPSDGSSAFISPDSSPAALPTITKVGRSYQFDASVTDLGSAPTPFLTAVGPGSAHFSIFSPGVENVFAFFDNVQDISDGTFTYHVAGWYSNQTFDPLGNVTWNPVGNPDEGLFTDATFGFAAYLGTQPAPTTMLVHGLVSGVQWDRDADNPPPASYPTDTRNNLKVAIGNTGLDALAALVQWANPGNPGEGSLLRAFGYGLLDRFDAPGSADEIDMAIREHWFAASPSGTLWTVVAPEVPGPTALPTPAPPSMTMAQLQALAALNAAEEELDRQGRILDSMAWNLYSLWWKYQWPNGPQNPNPPVANASLAAWLPTQLSNQIGTTSPTPDPGGWYVSQVTEQQAGYAAQKEVVDLATAALEGLLDPAGAVLKQINRSQFRAPNDPVLLVSGLGRSTNLDPVGDLTCRLVSQTISNLTVDGQTYCVSGSCDHQVEVPALSDPSELLPPGLQDLHTESMFLSPSLFAQSFVADPSKAPDVATAVAALAPAAETSFAPAQGSFDEWVQPWVPLLLDWMVTVLNQPAYTADQGSPVFTFSQQNWTFNGTDYDWTGPTDGSDGNFDESLSLPMQFSGRTFITPQLTFTLADQLDDWVQKHSMRDPAVEALLENLDSYLDGLRGQDVLSQSLGGMRARFIQRDYTPAAPPFGSITQALGSTILHGFPSPYPAQVYEDSSSSPVWDFAPMSGTFFVINKLSVIDFMGRTVDLMLSNLSTAPAQAGTGFEYWFYPIAAEGIKAATTQDPQPNSSESQGAPPRMLMLPPRLVQDAMVSLRLTANDSSNAYVELQAGANPVCGWFVPNHLDQSIAVYAADGTPWGELFLSRHVAGAFEPQWQPDPTNPAAPATVDAIPNQYVRQILQAFFTRTDNGAGLVDFLQAIDETLWTIDPGGEGKDAQLNVLVGRALAVVRMETSLRLAGLPMLSQDWWNTFDVDPSNLPDPNQPAPLGNVDGGVCDFAWPVRLGDSALRSDGLIGYFRDSPDGEAGAYPTFNAVQAPADATSGYLTQIGGGNYLELKPIDDTVTSPDPARQQSCRLTLLLDPRGSVHAFSGILPVAEISLPTSFSAPALATMAYLFRSGPLITIPEAVRIPRPAEQRGSWAWFDNVLGNSVPVVAADDLIALTTTAPVVREGWLRFTPNPSDGGSSKQ